MIGRVLALTVALLVAMAMTMTMMTGVAFAQDDEEEEEELYYEKESAAYLGLTGSGINASGDFSDVDDWTGGVGLILGGYVTTWLAFEGQYDFVADSASHLFSYSAKWLPMGDSQLQPYLKAGLGIMGGRDEEPFLFMGRFGAGVSFFLTETLAVDAGLNTAIAAHDNNMYMGTLGVIYYFE